LHNGRIQRIKGFPPLGSAMYGTCAAPLLWRSCRFIVHQILDPFVNVL